MRRSAGQTGGEVYYADGATECSAVQSSAVQSMAVLSFPQQQRHRQSQAHHTDTAHYSTTIAYVRTRARWSTAYMAAGSGADDERPAFGEMCSFSLQSGGSLHGGEELELEKSR